MTEALHKRLRVTYVCTLGLFLGLVCRLSWIQLYDHQWFVEQAEQMQKGWAAVLARRGPILDRNHRVLAESVWVDSVSADPSIVSKKRETAAALAPVLGLRVGQVLAQLEQDRRFVWLKRFVSKRESQAVRDADLRGVFLVPEPRRVYPLGRAACHVVGFCDIDGRGLEGVEGVCNGVLTGEAGRREVWRDGARRSMVLPGMPVQPAQDGRAVVLTIDAVVQSIVHRELTRVRKERRAEAAMSVVMDCNTGEVLASVSLPDFSPDRLASGAGVNPLRFTKKGADMRRNRVVCDLFEPGSIFKPFVASAAFETGAVKPDDIFRCHNGEFHIGRRVLHDVHGYGDLTARQCLIKSSNIGLAQIAMKTGKEDVYRYLVRFGFGQTTGFDLPGEPRGVLRHPKHWRPCYSLPSIAMGQEVSATPLRLVSSCCALGNGGIVPKPFAIAAHLDQATGKPVWEAQPGKGYRRAIRPETSRRVMSPILTDVVRVGTGRRAAQPGYAIGGKTGTAQLPAADGHGHAKKAFLASFMAIAPMDAPRICVAVMVVRPHVDKHKTYYGGRAAAPAAGRIITQTLLHLGVKPNYAGSGQLCQERSPKRHPGLLAAATLP